MAPTGTTYRSGTTLLVVLALLPGCATGPGDGVNAGSTPSGGPDLTGTVDRMSDPDAALLADSSEGGYDGMTLPLDDTALVDVDGRPVDPATVPHGAAVELWIAACAESLPPLCTVDVVRVTSEGAP